MLAASRAWTIKLGAAILISGGPGIFKQCIHLWVEKKRRIWRVECKLGLCGARLSLSVQSGSSGASSYPAQRTSRPVGGSSFWSTESSI